MKDQNREKTMKVLISEKLIKIAKMLEADSGDVEMIFNIHDFFDFSKSQSFSSGKYAKNLLSSILNNSYVWKETNKRIRAMLQKKKDELWNKEAILLK